MTEAIVAFLRGIGIDVVAGDLGDDTFLPGILTRDGRLVFEAERVTYPGDLLHEAGHLAVLDPVRRRSFGAVGEDQIPDMQRTELRAIAWSYAAAVHLRLDPAVVFHDGGYRDTLAAGATPTPSASTPGRPPWRRSD